MDKAQPSSPAIPSTRRQPSAGPLEDTLRAEANRLKSHDSGACLAAESEDIPHLVTDLDSAIQALHTGKPQGTK